MKLIHDNKGITLIEILIGILLLSFILYPLSTAFRELSLSNTETSREGLITFYAIGKMEEILAIDFSNIPLSSPPGTPLPAPYSDTVNISGKTVSRNVYVDLYDGNGDTIPDADLKKITVTVGDLSLSTLKANYP